MLTTEKCIEPVFPSGDGQIHLLSQCNQYYEQCWAYKLSHEQDRCRYIIESIYMGSPEHHVDTYVQLCNEEKRHKYRGACEEVGAVRNPHVLHIHVI